MLANYFDEDLEKFVFEKQVEIDKTYFKKKKSIINKTKKKTYRNKILDFWFDWKKNKNFIIKIVENKSGEIKIPKILTHVPFGQIIYSDEYSNYVYQKGPKKGTSRLKKFSYIHKYVKHKDEFVHKIFKNINIQNRKFMV